MTRPLLLSTALLVLAGSASAETPHYKVGTWPAPTVPLRFRAVAVWDERPRMTDEWTRCEAHPCASIYEARRHLFADASKTITKLVWECDPSDGEPIVGEAAHAGSLEIDAPTREQMGQRYVCVVGGEGLPVLYGDLAKSLAEPKP